MKGSNSNWRRDPVLWVYSILLGIPFIMVFTKYNTLGLTLCIYFGLFFIIVGFTLVLLAGYEFKVRGNAPEGESIVKTTTLVDTGVYSIIRHPQYLGFLTLVFGVLLLSQHWLGIVTGLLGSGLFYLDILKEEKMSVLKFGEEYRDYIRRVPRLNLFLGLYRVTREKKIKR
jgi:protein-S-isoprenylcysteine O-methyltransferase Ste14